MSLGASLGAFAESFAASRDAVRDRKEREANAARQDRYLDMLEKNPGMLNMGAMGAGGGGMGAARPAGGSGGGAVSAQGSPVPTLKVADPANVDLPPHARAFLNAISAGESGGAYNVRYSPKGGVTFDMNGQHPRIFEEGPHGKSSAAGRYQFTATTWDDITGGKVPFTDRNQDQYAWELAKRDYRRNGGGDLDAELAAGKVSEGTFKTLAPTWAAFNNGRNKWLGVYNDSYARYSTPKPANPPLGARPPAY